MGKMNAKFILEEVELFFKSSSELRKNNSVITFCSCNFKMKFILKFYVYYSRLLSICTYYIITEDSIRTFYTLLFSSSPYKMGIIFGGYVLTYVPLSVNFSSSEHSAPYNFRERGKVGLTTGRRETPPGSGLEGEKAEE